MSPKSKVPFSGTKEQEKRLLAVVEKYKDTKGALVPVLHEAQDIYGYLPFEVQKLVSEKMNIPLSEIYGVVTFYTQFSLNPKGKFNISVCMGTACYVRGAGAILDKVKEKLKIKVSDLTPDGKFSLDATRCIGACGLAPVLTVNEDVYGRLAPEDIDGIIEKYMKM